MKNLKYFPFERNRYFYGKFLSVDDFEAEQRYMNDKRRLLNRFLHGYGVVCGLQVVEIDDMTISIESGLALDFSGREIMMAAPVTKRLSAIEGYLACTEREEKSEEERQELYLCIAYAEQKIDPVHSIARAEADEEEYNKYAEGYRLFLTTQEAEQESLQFDALYEDKQTIFHGNGIRIWQTVPRYIQSGEEAEIVVVVQKSGQMEKIAFSYQMRLDHMEQKGNAILTVEFDESRFAPSDTYVLNGSIRAKAVTGQGSIEIVPDSFSLTIGNDQRKEAVSAKFQVDVSEAGVSEMVWKNYYSSAMEDLMKDPYHGAVYLAKLEVIRAGDTYVIEGVESLPYRQYVWNNMLGGALEIFRQKQELLTKWAGNVRIEQKKKPDAERSGGDIQIRTGSVNIDLGIGGVSGQRFYSSEIIHGLGPGQVFIFLGLTRELQQEKQVIYGSQDIFSENSDAVFAMAAKADLGRGSFVIGIQCLRNVRVKNVKICWMAVRDQERPEKEIRHLLIRPDIANLTLRESRMFEADIDGKPQKNIRWSVREAEGGSIDRNGCYTAPNRAGVYQIIAESMEEDGVRAYAYAIVRDVP